MLGDISSKLRALRTARGLTQKNLALLAGISQQHLSHLEQGRGGVELATLSKLLDALGQELAFVPRAPTPAAALAERARQWDRFAAWEAARPPARGSLVEAGALADFFLSRHAARPTQPELRAHGERLRLWRERLARIGTAAP